MKDLTVLVLAGSRSGANDPVALASGVSHKAVAPVGGVPMILRVVSALRRVPAVGRIVVSTDMADMAGHLPGLAEAAGGLPVEFVAAAASPSVSVGEAIERLGTPLLVTTADHALLKPEWVTYFIDHLPEGAAVAAGVAEMADIADAAPNTRRTYFRLRDGAFSGCNLFFFADPSSMGAVRLWREVEGLRKKPGRVVRLLGLMAIFRYAAGLMTSAEAMGRLGRLAGAEIAAVRLPFGHAAIDVDSVADLALVEALLKDGKV